MSLLTRPVDELIRYILKRLHGGLIRNDLDAHNFSSHLSGGRFNLSDLELNPEAVNALLPDSAVHLLAASIGKIKVQTPSLRRLLEDSVIVEAENVEADFCSAALSGFAVPPPQDSLEASDHPEDDSAMIFGRAVEQILTNMKFLLLGTRIRLRASRNSTEAIELYIAEIALKDTSTIGGLHRTKELKVKGVIVSVSGERVRPDVFNPLDYAHVCKVEEEMTVSVAVSREVAIIDARVKRLLCIFSPAQVRTVYEVVTALDRCAKVQDDKEGEMTDLLQRTYLALDEDVRRQLQGEKKRKAPSLKAAILSLHIVLMTEEPRPPRNRTWDLLSSLEPYTSLGASHLVLSASEIHLEQSQSQARLKVQSLEVWHHDLVEAQSIGGSSIFMSAMESYSSAFFRTNSMREEVYRMEENCHMCSTPVLYFESSRESLHTYLPEYDFRPARWSLKAEINRQALKLRLGAVYLNLKEPLIRTLSVYSSNFPAESKARSPSAAHPYQVSLEIPLIRVAFQCLDCMEYICACHLRNKRPWCCILDLSRTTSRKEIPTPGLSISTLTDQVSLFLISEHELEQLGNIQGLEIAFSSGSGSGIESYYCVTLTEERGNRAKKEMYIPGQGTLVVPEYIRASEPYDSDYVKMCPQVEELSPNREEEEKALEASKMQLKLVVHSLQVNLDPICVQQVADLVKNPHSAAASDNQPLKIGLILAIDSIKMSLMEKKLLSSAQVHVSHFPQTQFQRSTMISTLDASAIRSRTVTSSVRAGKMTDRRLPVAVLSLNTVELVCFGDFEKQGQTFVRLGVSRVTAAWTRPNGDFVDFDIFAYSLHPANLPKVPNLEAITILCTLSSYGSPIVFVTRIDPTQPLFRSRSDSAGPNASKEIAFTCMFRALVFRIDKALPLLPRLLPFAKVDFGESKSLDLMKIKLQAKDILLDYEVGTRRGVLEVDDFSFWTALVTNLQSKGMHVAVSSVQLYIVDCEKDNRADLRFPVVDPKGKVSDFVQDALGFVQVLSLDSVELFFSQVVNPQKLTEAESVPDESPPLLSCLLGGTRCKHVSGSLYMCDLAQHPLKHDILDVHLNLGCAMLFACHDSLKALQELATTATKDVSAVLSKATEEHKEGDSFDESLANAGVAVHYCASKGSKVNLMNIAESNAWNAQVQAEPASPHSASSLDGFEDFEDSPPLPDAQEEDLQASEETYLFRLPHVIHSHISFPSIVKLETIDSDFHQLKPQHGFPVMRITASLTHISAALYQGSDFDFLQPGPELRPNEGFSYKETALRRRMRRERRILSCSLKLRQESTGITFTQFPRKLHYAWRLSFTIRDFEVLDQIQLSDVFKLLHINREFQRTPGMHMLAVDVCSVWPKPDVSEEEELRLAVKLLPLKINLDQYAVNFIVDLMEKEKPIEQELHTAVRPPPLTSSANPVMRSTQNVKMPIALQRPVEGFVQSMKIEAISLTLDYIPRNFLFEGVSAASPANAMNLFPIENLCLKLPEAHIKGQRSVKEAIMLVCNVWEAHIRSNEIFSILGGIGPLSSVRNVAGALINVIKMPYSSANPLNSAKKSLITLATVVSVESLGLLGAALTTVHTAIGSIGRIAGIEGALLTRQQVTRHIRKAQDTLDPKTQERNKDKYKT